MNIALVLQHKLLLGIQRLILGATAPAPQSLPCVRSPALPCTTHTPRLGSVRGEATTPVNKQPTTRVMPLRVMRVLETGQPRSCAGRLVISGRMADVCAELDRLVAREASLH